MSSVFDLSLSTTRTDITNGTAHRRFEPHLPIHVFLEKRRLRNTPGYLGMRNAGSHYTWMPSNVHGGLYLVSKAEKSYFDHYTQVAAESGGITRREPDPATLTAIVRLSDKDDSFYFTACGTPTRNETSVFFSCFGEAPDHPELARDYQQVLLNLEEIEHDLHTQVVDGPFHIIATDCTMPRIKFEHTLLSGVASEEECM
jgi:hypothetical protein